MSEQEIIEGNKLIAEFMGIRITKSKYGCNHPLVTCSYPDYSNLKYHSSWDWLMPVVSKIGKMYEDLVKNAYKTKTTISYDIDSTYADVICRNVTIDIGHLFERVVAFIKWYNTCQKN